LGNARLLSGEDRLTCRTSGAAIEVGGIVVSRQCSGESQLSLPIVLRRPTYVPET